jgi:hypothetical protein
MTRLRQGSGVAGARMTEDAAAAGRALDVARTWAIVIGVVAGVVLAVWVNFALVNAIAEAVATERVCKMTRPHFLKPDVCFGVLP